MLPPLSVVVSIICFAGCTVSPPFWKPAAPLEFRGVMGPNLLMGARLPDIFRPWDFAPF